jgi:hypothetical protein
MVVASPPLLFTINGRESNNNNISTFSNLAALSTLASSPFQLYINVHYVMEPCEQG